MRGRRAVIFDIDGVLIDSYQAHFQSWHEAAARRGYVMTEEDFAATFGRTNRDIIATLWDPNLSADQADELGAQKESAYRDLVRHNFPTMAGAPDLLEDLRRQGYSMGLGSSGPPENVQLTWDRLGGERYFTAAVNGQDVSRGKPDPEVFLLVAQRLGVDPARCAVVEDASAGIAAARAAGMTAIGFCSTGHQHDEFREAHLVVDSLTELSVQRIAQLIDSRDSSSAP
jgi:beta-phosphoglucomutase